MARLQARNLTLEERLSRYAAALYVWHTFEETRWSKPNGTARGLTKEQSDFVDESGYPFDHLPRCADPDETPQSELRKKFLNGDLSCRACGRSDDSHLMFSSYCSEHCHSVNHHFPTVESLADFGAELTSIIKYQQLGGSDESFLESCGIDSGRSEKD